MHRAGSAFFAALAAAVACLQGCASKAPAPVRPDLTSIETPDVPRALRNTIGAMATLYGAEPVLVSGFGIAVNTTGGGGLLRPEIQATMERELASRNMTTNSEAFDGTPFAGHSPRDFLSRRDTAVVVVWAVVPPGAPAGYDFDVYVESLPNSGVRSLEGATLWSTDLRLGLPSVLGGIQAQRLGVAKGPLFVNVFPDAETGSVETPRTQGRVLGGGVVTQPMELAVALNTDSHARARAAQTSINTRFPPRGGQRVQTARGRGRTGNGGSQIVAVSIPKTWSSEPAAFLSVLRNLQIERSFDVEATAFAYVEAVKADPYLWEDIAWALEAVGEDSLPAIRTLYDYPESLPRAAGLRAGARLNDPLVIDHLVDQAAAPESTASEAVEAIELLGRIRRSGPMIDRTLQQRLGDGRLTVRVAAFESLMRRGATEMVRREVYTHDGPTMAERSLKAVVDTVPIGEPLVYVKQQGRPHIVLFGENPRITGDPVVQALPETEEVAAGAAPDHRLLIVGDDDDGPLRVSFRSRRGGRQSNNDTISRDLARFIEYMARSPSLRDPRPGLDLSYSEVVSVLAAMSQHGALGAPLRVERDKLFAEIVEAARTTRTPDREEFGRAGLDLEDATGSTAVTRAASEDPDERGPDVSKSLLVPIEPREGRRRD
jgi:hypothetical protein